MTVWFVGITLPILFVGLNTLDALEFWAFCWISMRFTWPDSFRLLLDHVSNWNAAQFRLNHIQTLARSLNGRRQNIPSRLLVANWLNHSRANHILSTRTRPWLAMAARYIRYCLVCEIAAASANLVYDRQRRCLAMAKVKKKTWVEQEAIRHHSQMTELRRTAAG